MTKILTLLLLITLLSSSTCSKEDTVTINCENLINDPLDVNDHANVYIPNAFTPNGDGLNDDFRMFFRDIISAKITVYDSHSNVIFNTENMSQFWKPGTSVIGNIYYYRVEAMSNTGKRIGKCGEVKALNCSPTGVAYTFISQLNLDYTFTNPSGEVLCP